MAGGILDSAQDIGKTWSTDKFTFDSFLSPQGFASMGNLLGGIGSVGSFYNSWQQNEIAREQMEMQEFYAKFNANAMAQTYNTGLAHNQQELLGQSAPGQSNHQDMDSYMSENKIKMIS